MKSRIFTNPVLWTVLGGVAVGTLGYSQYRRTDRVLSPTLAVQAVPVRGTEVRPDLALSLKTLDEATASLADYALPAVVSIETSNTKKAAAGNIFGGDLEGGVGSGVIIRPDGYILTNDHVVADFDKVKVKLNDGRSFDGEVRRAQDSDLAVIKIEAKDLPSLAFGDSNKVRPGQFAMAIGSPYNLPYTVTLGHVSALNRKNVIPDQRQQVYRSYYGLIQTDAAINRGNSGGPLINVQGEIIGINTTIFSTTGASNGIGFAIPGNEARIITEQLIQGKTVQRGALGVRPSEVPEYKKKALKVDSGAYVDEAPQSNAPAAAAGIKQGDVIVRVGTVNVQNETDLRDSMLQYGPGADVDVEYVRDGQHHVTKVKLASLTAINGDQLKLKEQKEPTTSDEDLRKLFEDQDIPGLPKDQLHRFFQKRDGGASQAQPERKVGGPAKLGVQVSEINAETRKAFHIPAEVKGAMVASIESGSVADSLGVQTGDVITRLGNKTIQTPKDLVDAMKSVKWGDQSHIEYSRYGASSVARGSIDITFR